MIRPGLRPVSAMSMNVTRWANPLSASLSSSRFLLGTATATGSALASASTTNGTVPSM